MKFSNTFIFIFLFILITKSIVRNYLKYIETYNINHILMNYQLHQYRI